MNDLAEFNNFVNSPVANYKGELYNLPFNMNTFNKMWGVITPAEAKAKIEEQIADLNITEDDAFLAERRTAMQNGWRERYTQEDGFRSAGSKYVDDRANAMLILSGLAGEAD